ncbi:MAG TPA: hypothetical protein PLO56_06245 [Rhodothermales bacterium]|nr:hypothetical protein [Rhodothermales bacterium]
MIPLQVVKHYAFKYGVSLDISMTRHKELESFLRKASSERKSLVPTLQVDEVWHNFILHTKLYAQYCTTEFGLFIHHNPHIPTEQVQNNLARCDVQYEPNNCNGGSCEPGIETNEAIGAIACDANKDKDGSGDIEPCDAFTQSHNIYYSCDSVSGCSSDCSRCDTQVHTEAIKVTV